MNDERNLPEQVEDTPVEPCRPPVPLATPALPGLARQARAAGCDDEYDNAIQARYGEGW